MERRRLVNNQIRQIEEERLKRIDQAPCDGPNIMVRLLARVMGVGIETADMLVHEVLSRNMRDRRAVARYAGLTGSPDESGRKRREKGLARSGNTRVRRGMIQLAWRFLLHQKNSALTKWYRSRTENARGTRKPMIVGSSTALTALKSDFRSTPKTEHRRAGRPCGFRAMSGNERPREQSRSLPTIPPLLTCIAVRSSDHIRLRRTAHFCPIGPTTRSRKSQ